MTRQVLKMLLDGTYTVIFDDEATENRYVIYRRALGHKKIEKKCEDFSSCMEYLKEIVPAGCTHSFGGKR